jgi:nicotinamide-nucleotide amidase
MTASILSIGNELLIGQVINTNAAWLGEVLSAMGVQVVAQATTSDDALGIRQQLDHLLACSEVVITTGGLGPTRDDVTKKVVAAYFGQEMVFHEGTWERINEWFSKRNYPVSELHRAQCYMPSGAQILENNLGTAPGLLMTSGDKTLIILPGVPYEMKGLFEAHVRQFLNARLKGQDVWRHTFQTAGTGETVIADHVESFEQALSTHYSIAYLPSLGQVRIRLNANGVSQRAFEDKCNTLRQLLEPWLFAEGNITMEEELGRLLYEKELMMCTAESCTGGQIASKICAIAGASRYFKSSVVAYSNEIKASLLGVPVSVFETEGAVSEACVRSMLSGALRLLGADVGIAVSGIAGPDGGSALKPVGTIWIAVGNDTDVHVQCLSFNKDRQRNIAFATSVAMNNLRKFILKHYI